MKGVYSFEEQIKNPKLSIIDFEYIILHPEAKLAIQERYYTDPFFRERIDRAKAKNYAFKEKFEQYFGLYRSR